MFGLGIFELLIVALLGFVFCLGPIVAIGVAVWLSQRNATREEEVSN